MRRRRRIAGIPERSQRVTRLLVSHLTTYRYAEPVSFGPHRMMLRPRDSHEMRLFSATLTTSLPAELEWTYDVFGNVIATARFEGSTDTLSIESHLEIERFASAVPTLFETGADVPYPLAYSSDEMLDLGACLAGQGEAFSDDLEQWIERILASCPGGAMEILRALCLAIHGEFAYETRFEGTARTAAETFALKSGACRDFAAFFIALARRLGFGARFVSGYLFDPPEDTGGLQGVGATHAWAEVYLPGAGWIEFDPTNGLIASDRLIRVAVAREAFQAIPISGSFVGSPTAFAGLWVGVNVERLDEAAPRAAA
jgi:transglutaminase-like putative cysteine protease